MKTAAALLFKVILCGLLLVVEANGAEPYLVSKAYWVDQSGKAPLKDALNAPFTSYDAAVTQGYTSAAVWLKLRIAGSDTRLPLALIVQPAFLRKLELYDPSLLAHDEQSYPIVSGRDAKREPHNHIGLDNGFVIATGAQPRDIFLRITTTTSLTAHARVIPLEEARRKSVITGGVLAVYFAFLLSLCLWALINLTVRREIIYALFVVRIIYSMAHLFVWIGLLRYFLPDLDATSTDFIYSAVTVTIVAVAGHFDLKLLSTFGPPEWLQNSYRIILSLSFVSLALLLLGYTQTALRINALIVSAAMIVLLLLALFTREQEKTPHQRSAIIVIRVGFSVMTLLIITPVPMHQKLIVANLAVMNLMFLHAVVSATILSAILSIRARQRDWQTQTSLLHYQLQEREIQAENLRLSEKERFLSMLTHELRNPLALIRLVTTTDSPAGKTVEKAALEMTSIIERVEQSERLDDQAINAQMLCLNLRDTLEELVNTAPLAQRIDLTVKGDLSVTTDEMLVRSIIKNLLENAHKYSPPWSRIRVDAIAVTRDGKSGVAISVTNAAGDAGVPDVERLFTKYYRNSRAHRQPGSGLGLFLVASWAKALGGTVSYDTQKQRDGIETISFSLWFPQ